jgi:hypothetical protein
MCLRLTLVAAFCLAFPLSASAHLRTENACPKGPPLTRQVCLCAEGRSSGTFQHRKCCASRGSAHSYDPNAELDALGRANDPSEASGGQHEQKTRSPELRPMYRGHRLPGLSEDLWPAS